MVQILETRDNYHKAIGEFIVAFAQVELYMTMYDVVILTKNSTNVPLVGSFAKGFIKKVKNVTKFFDEVANDLLSKKWDDVEREIRRLYLFRNHLIHGTGFSSFFSENIRTMIDEDTKRDKLSFKNLSIDDIKKLSDDTYHVLTGVNGIQGYFLQDFLKITREYFQSGN